MRRQVLPILALLCLVGLAACDSGTVQVARSEAAAPSEPVVFRVSPDGRRLEGYRADDGVTPQGSVALPEGAVWSVAGVGEDLRVWVHSDARVMLVNASDWKVIGDWARPLGAPEQRMLAQRGNGAS